MRRMHAQAGFTLMEVLVAVVIVGLTVTVFFQLMSTSLRLEVRSRQTAEAVVEARMLFDRLMAMDVRGDFPWSGESQGRSWNVSMFAVDTADTADAPASDDSETVLRAPSELYKLVLDFTARSGRTVRLALYRAFRSGELGQGFKDVRVQPLPKGEQDEQVTEQDQGGEGEART